MTCNVWYKAFSISCVIHLFIILLLTIFIKNIDSLQLSEEQIVIEFTEVAAGNSQDSELVSVKRETTTGSTVPFSANVASIPAKMATTTQTVVSTKNSQAIEGKHVASITALDDSAVGGNGTGSMVNSGIEVAGGVQSVENVSMDSIINKFLSQVEKRKDYPYIARRRGQEGTVTVAVRLNAAGELDSAQVVRSSGVAALDEAALTLVRRVCPFSHNAGRAIAMNIPIAYQLE